MNTQKDGRNIFDGITLILNAAEGLLQVVAMQDGVRLFAQEWHAPTRGTEILAPALAEAFGHLRLSMSDISHIATVNGPGNFTGLRLCLATAAGIARHSGAQQAGLDYMHALADRPFFGAGDIVWVLTHARRNLVHAQGFVVDNNGALPRAFCPVDVITLEQAANRIILHAEEASSVAPRIPVVLGSGLTRNVDFFTDFFANVEGEKETEGLTSDVMLLSSKYDAPSLSALMRLTNAAVWQNADITPYYVRPCDAEENLPHIAAKQGRDIHEAREALHVLTHKGLEG